MDTNEAMVPQVEGDYRDATGSLRAAWERQRARLERAMTGAEFQDVVAARVGRTAFGATLTLGFVVMGLRLLAAAFGHGAGDYSRNVDVAHVLGASWVVAVVAGFVAWGAANVAASALLQRSCRALFDAEDPRADHARWQEDASIERVLRGAHADGAWSASAPLVGVSLMGPLGLHGLFMLARGEGAGPIGEWVAISLVIVGHCHVVLAALGWFYGRRIMRQPKWGESGIFDGFKALGWTFVSSLFPGVLLILVPPALVAVTGVAFVPWAWWWVTTRSYRERDALRGCTFAS